MLKVAVVILIIMLAYSGIYSLINVFAPKVLMKSSFKAITGQALDSVTDAGYLKALSGSHRYMGVYSIATVISGFFVLFAGFRKAQKWAWWAFLVVGGIMWLWGLINAIIFVDVGNLIGHIIGLILLLVGILIPIKVFFVKAAEEAPQEAQETQE
jgi:hypothetical protein